MKILLLTISLALAVFVLSCASSGPTGSMTLELLAGDWVIEELGGEAVQASQGAEPMPTLRIEADGKFGGFGGVNRYNGKLDTSALMEGRFDLGPFVSTRMAGTPEAMALESQVFDMLARADSCAMRDDDLILFHEGDIVARLSPGS